MVNKEDILVMGNTIFDYFAKNKTYPKTVKIKGVDYTIQQCTYLMSRFITNINVNDIPKINVGGAKNPTGDRCNREVIKNTYQDMSKRLNQFIKQNGYLPNYVTIDGKQKCSIILFMLQLSKIVKSYKERGNLPGKILINSNDLVKPTPAPTVDKVYAHFVKVFGKVSSIDEALEKIQGLGYGFYYDNKYSNIETIDHLAQSNVGKPNCTDVHQMLWHVGKALGYDVRALHVWCNSSNVGHVRLQFKHPKNTEGYWVNRDGACVINGGSITDIWCSSGTLIAINPDWFFEDLNY